MTTASFQALCISPAFADFHRLIFGAVSWHFRVVIAC
jgi:hypothetical protein